MILSRLISRTCLWVLRQSTHCVNCLVFKLNGFDYLDGFRTAGLIGVYGRAGIVTIGENVEINSAYWANPIGGGKKTQFQLLGGNITIGNSVGLSNVSITSKTSVTIGNKTMIGAGTVIYDTDFHPIDPQRRECFQEAKSKPVIIEENVFIGAHCIILKGSHIGRNSVVGAGSVVSANIPENEVWAGNPARFVRKI